MQRDPTRKSSFQWPKTTRSSSSYICVWRKALCQPFGLSAGHTLYVFMLGHWLHNNFSNWRWMFDPQTHNLYQMFGNIWKLWKCCGRCLMGKNSKFHHFANTQSLPLIPREPQSKLMSIEQSLLQAGQTILINYTIYTLVMFWIPSLYNWKAHLLI